MSIARDSINDILSIDNKVDKIIGKSLSTEDYTTADKNKLFGIATNANNYSHPASGVSADTYKSVTVDVNGHVTGGTNPTTVSGYGLTDVYTKTESNTSLALKVNNSEKGVENGVATLDANGKVVLTQIPDSVLGQLEYMGVHNFTTMPTATRKGQYWIASVSGNGYIVGDWAVWNGSAFDKVDNTDAVATVAGRTGNVVLTKSDVGLANVDNTADSDKPVSTAQQTALNLKANLDSPTFTRTVTAPTFSGSLSGNATSATTATSASTAAYATNAGSADNIDGIAFKNANVTSSFVVDTQATNGIGYSTGYSLFGQSDGAVYAGVYDANHQHQIVGDFRTGKIAVRGKNIGTWQPWKEVAYTDSNITGNAATATTVAALGNYVWSAADLPNTYPIGIQNSFVSGSQGFPEYGSVMNIRTYLGGGGSLQLYTPYGPSNGGNNLKVRFGNYNVNSGNSWTAWKELATTDGNISGNAGSATIANTINNSGNSLTFNWSGQGGQPAWLFGSNDGLNAYVYNPSNFSVNYANSAGYATTAAVGTNNTQIATTAFVLANSNAVNTTTVGNAVAGLDVGAVGTYASLSKMINAGSIAVGETAAGTNLKYTGISIYSTTAGYPIQGGQGANVLGTWKAMGYCQASGNFGYYPSTVWLRIA